MRQPREMELGMASFTCIGEVWPPRACVYSGCPIEFLSKTSTQASPLHLHLLPCFKALSSLSRIPATSSGSIYLVPVTCQDGGGGSDDVKHRRRADGNRHWP